MGKDRILGPGLGVVLLASVVFGAVYWGIRLINNNDTYFYHFVSKMDQKIEEAYGRGIPVEDTTKTEKR